MPAPLPSNLVALLPRELDPNVVTAHALLAGGLDSATGESLLLVHAGRPVLLTRDAPGKPFGAAPLDGERPLRVEGDKLQVATGGKERSIPLNSWLDRELAKSFVTSPGSGGAVSFGLAHPPPPVPAPAAAPAPSAPAASSTIALPASGALRLTARRYQGNQRYKATVALSKYVGLESGKVFPLLEQGGVVADNLSPSAAEAAKREFEEADWPVVIEASTGAPAPAPVAAPPPAVAPPPAYVPPPVASGSLSAPTGGSYQVRIAPYAGRTIIMAIKTVRERSGLGLAESKALVEQGGVLVPGSTEQAAKELARQLTQDGCQATVESH